MRLIYLTSYIHPLIDLSIIAAFGVEGGTMLRNVLWTSGVGAWIESILSACNENVLSEVVAESAVAALIQEP